MNKSTKNEAAGFSFPGIKSGFLFLVLSLAMLILISCKGEKASDGQVETQDTVIREGMKKSDAELRLEEELGMYAVLYKGVVPCDGCPGKQVTLRMTQHGDLFSLSEQRMGIDTLPKITEGSMKVERGFESDGDASLYTLYYNPAEKENMYFVRFTAEPGWVTMLTKDMKVPKEQYKYKLERMNKPPAQ